MSALTDTFTAIANKIRAKLGVQTTYTPAEMPSGIDDVYAKGVSDTKVGTASAGDVLSGKTFTNASSVGANGSMTNKGSTDFTITNTSPVTIPAGYYNGSGKIQTSGMMVTPSAAVNINSNGSHNVTNYATANVSISGSASLYKAVDINNMLMSDIPIEAVGTYIVIIIKAVDSSNAPGIRFYNTNGKWSAGSYTSLSKVASKGGSGYGCMYSYNCLLLNWNSSKAAQWTGIRIEQVSYSYSEANVGTCVILKISP